MSEEAAAIPAPHESALPFPLLSSSLSRSPSLPPSLPPLGPIGLTSRCCCWSASRFACLHWGQALTWWDVVNVLYGRFATLLAGDTHVLLARMGSGLGPYLSCTGWFFNCSALAEIEGRIFFILFLFFSWLVRCRYIMTNVTTCNLLRVIIYS